MENNTTVEKVVNIFKNGWNKQVILYGPPGTSKTYSATEIAAKFLANPEKNNSNIEDDIEMMKNTIKDTIKDTNTIDEMTPHETCEKYLETKKDQYKVIQFHPSYSYEDFVRGIVVKTKDKDGKNLTTPTYEVERKIIETFGEGATKEKPRVLVIDEINRAPLGSVLGELIYGLEYRGKPVSTPYVFKENEEEKPLKVSEYLYIIGTMNTADRSIGTMDYAVRRRFAFIPVYPCADVIKNSWHNEAVGEKAKSLFDAFMKGADKEDKVNNEPGIFEYLEDTELDVNDIKIGHTYFLGKKEEKADEQKELEYLRYRINYQIKPVYQEYIKDGLIKKEGLARFDEIVENVLSKNNVNNLSLNE